MLEDRASGTVGGSTILRQSIERTRKDARKREVKTFVTECHTRLHELREAWLPSPVNVNILTLKLRNN